MLCAILKRNKNELCLKGYVTLGGNNLIVNITNTKDVHRCPRQITHKCATGLYKMIMLLHSIENSLNFGTL